MTHQDDFELSDLQVNDTETESTSQLLHDSHVTLPSPLRSKSFAGQTKSRGATQINLLEDVNLDPPTRSYEFIDGPPKRKCFGLFDTNNLSALRHFVCVQVPSIAITLVLISLYAAKIHWDNPSVEALDALQFAAKAHETLILMSLGDILLCRISHSLQNQDVCVPIGFVSSAFYLGAPLRYFISDELWAPILRPGRKLGSDKTTFAMIVFVTILCLGASPLSAILMIPRQRWWVDEHFSSFYDHQYIMQVANMTYRSILDSGSGPLVNTSWHLTAKTEEISPGLLPAVPSEDILLLNEYGTPAETPAAAEIMLVNVSFSNYRAVSRSTSVGAVDNLVFATCPLSSLAWGLARISRLHVGDTQGTIPILTGVKRRDTESTKVGNWKQPLLVVTCARSELHNGVADFSFDSIFVNEILSLDVKSSSALAGLNKKAGPVLGPLGYRYLNLRETKGWPVSADILFGTVSNRTNPLAVEYHLCLIFARWVEADVWIEPSKSADVLSHLPFSRKEIPSRVKDAFGTQDFIHIHSEWMAGIGTLPNATFYEAMLNYYEKDLDRYTLQKVLALQVIDAIAGVGTARIASPEPVEKFWFPIDIAVITRYVYTYAFDLTSSPVHSYCLLHSASSCTYDFGSPDSDPHIKESLARFELGKFRRYADACPALESTD